jgi:hypothetical protein
VTVASIVVPNVTIGVFIILNKTGLFSKFLLCHSENNYGCMYYKKRLAHPSTSSL